MFDLFDEFTNRILSAKAYADFRGRLEQSGCTKCPLSAARNHIVVDRGNPESPILVIGEGPGEQEDLQGKAFVGKAGQLMDKIMAAIGLDTNTDMLIANVVKCRPPDNRAPHTDEVQACLPFLQRQIELQQPKIVLLLGATSLRHMDPTKKNFSMADQAGTFFELPEYPGIRFMVLYHPAALLYNARLKPDMWEHVKRLRKFLDEENILPKEISARQS
jgi:DNA polymerase